MFKWIQNLFHTKVKARENQMLKADADEVARLVAGCLPVSVATKKTDLKPFTDHLANQDAK